MKVSDMPYQRITVEEFKEQAEKIIANFNGTSGDIDVITHEFGHALAADYMFKFAEPDYPTGMETHE